MIGTEECPVPSTRMSGVALWNDAAQERRRLRKQIDEQQRQDRLADEIRERVRMYELEEIS